MPFSSDEKKITGDIRRIYEADQMQAEASIEAYLKEELEGVSCQEKMAFLERVSHEFGLNEEISQSPSSHIPAVSNIDNEVLSKVFSLFLGREVFQANLSPSELLGRLSTSINTIFDMLNELVRVIDTVILGESTGEETIRKVIGSHLGDDSHIESIERYLGQIKRAFLNVQKAFKESFHEKMHEVIDELNPEKISESVGKSIKIGPLRKAEYYQIYEKKYGKCRKWFESGKFMEDFLKAFEKNFHKLSR